MVDIMKYNQVRGRRGRDLPLLRRFNTTEPVVEKSVIL
jgi:hypothetical protein